MNTTEGRASVKDCFVYVYGQPSQGYSQRNLGGGARPEPYIYMYKKQAHVHVRHYQKL